MQVTVECQKRPEGTKPRALRREGLIPATVYGHQGAESTALVMDKKAALTLLKKASVNNTLVDLNITDLDWSGKALIREVQAHPWKKTLYHLSFFATSAQDSLEVVVPINLVGESVGVKKGGVIEQVTTEVKIQCAPEKIPEAIDMDISALDLGTMLAVKDLVLPEGIETTDDPDRTIIHIAVPRGIVAGGGAEE